MLESQVLESLFDLCNQHNAEREMSVTSSLDRGTAGPMPHCTVPNRSEIPPV
jgi:hypothetical protein